MEKGVFQPHSATAPLPADRWRQGLRARKLWCFFTVLHMRTLLAPNRRQEQPKDWALEDRVSGLLHRGTLEAGLGGGAGAAAGSGGAGCYFLLTKKGADFVAQPVHEWFTFRPVNARWEVVPTLRRTLPCRVMNRSSRPLESRLRSLRHKGEDQAVGVELGCCCPAARCCGPLYCIALQT